MLAPPVDLDIVELTAALAEGWSFNDPTLDYLPVGFGSHHWRATDRNRGQWFVTVDEHRDPSSIDNLRRAFGTASALHRDAGLAFVCAPTPDASGNIVRVLGGGAFTVAVTPWLEAAPLGEGKYTSTEDQAKVLQLLGRLHVATPRIDHAVTPRIDLALPDIEALCAALDGIDEFWSSGPFAEPTRTLLRTDQRRLSDALARNDELVDNVLSESAPWVVTHGEPHTANVLRGSDEALHLIDWDTLRLAPRERDLWMVIDPTINLQPYQAEVGEAPISAAALRLFRMRWDLGEIALYISQFHAPHDDDPNMRESWKNLGECLPVSEDHLASVPE